MHYPERRVHTHRPTLLLLETNQAVADSLSHLLAGMRVLVAQTIDEAKELFAVYKSQIEVVVIDTQPVEVRVEQTVCFLQEVTQQNPEVEIVSLLPDRDNLAVGVKHDMVAMEVKQEMRTCRHGCLRELLRKFFCLAPCPMPA